MLNNICKCQEIFSKQYSWHFYYDIKIKIGVANECYTDLNKLTLSHFKVCIRTND